MPFLNTSKANILLNEKRILSGHFTIESLNIPFKALKNYHLVIQIFVNDSIPVATHEAPFHTIHSPRNSDQRYSYYVQEQYDDIIQPFTRRVNLAELNIRLPHTYETGSLDIHVGVQEYQALIAIYRRGEIKGRCSMNAIVLTVTLR